MIEYKIKDPSYFIRCIKSIATIADNTVLQFGGKLRTYGMDGSRICLYELSIGKSELEIINDGRIDVMINMPDFQKILNRFRNPDVLKIQYANNIITIIGHINNKKKTFKLAVLDLDVPPDPMESLNKLELNSVFKIDLTDFIDMIEDTEIFSDCFNIITKDLNKVIIEGFGVIGESRSEIDLPNGITADEKCSYSLSFTKNILKTLGSQEVTINFSHNMPIMIFDKLSKDSYIKWYLGPRVEQDD